MQSGCDYYHPHYWPDRRNRDGRGSNGNEETRHMKRSTLARSAAVCVCLGLAAPLLAAQLPAPDAANQSPPSKVSPSIAKPAETCLNDLRAFDHQMEKDGYWVADAGAGLGYPAGGLAAGYDDPMNSYPLTAASGYPNARPGYELRTLVAAADILAR